MNSIFKFSGSDNLKDNELTKENFQNSDFTLQCWIQTKSSGELLSKHTPETSFSLLINALGNVVFSVMNNEITHKVIANTISVRNEDWYHITAIKTSGFLELYINGTKQSISTISEVSETPKNVHGFTIGGTSETNFFQGNIGQITVWNKALTVNEITLVNMEEDGEIKKKSGLIKLLTTPEKEQATASPDLFGLSVTISIRNTSFDALTLQNPEDCPVHIPQSIAVNTEEVIELNNFNIYKTLHQKMIYGNSSGKTTLIVKKSLDTYSTVITAISEGDLVDDLSITRNTPFSAEAKLIIGENQVVVNMRNVHNFLSSVNGFLKCDQIQTPGGNLFEQISYNKASQVFNRRFQKKPFAIIFCESTEDVQRVYKEAIANNLAIRVRSGGHDHEAECTGTNVILLDMTRINHVTVSADKKYARIGPGIRFKDLTPQLAFNDVMIPHGTCATVGVAGFTFGGGWGPWTRKYGMNCEGLVGATVVLGNGDIVKLHAEDSDKKDLLWALKGGGGMSYGIVTELELKVFPLPKKLIKFELEWNLYDKKDQHTITGIIPTKKILTAWENVIMNNIEVSETDEFNNIQLIGTNLKVSGKNLKGNLEDFDAEKEVHNCIMYGYWDGSEASLIDFVKVSYKNVLPDELRVTGKGGQRLDYADDGLMSEWDRMSHSAISRNIHLQTNTDVSESTKTASITTEKAYDRIYKIHDFVPKTASAENHTTFNQFELVNTKKPLPPDLDAPAPHKITSRLANHGGLGNNGKNQLINSLTSKLILDDNRTYGLFTYITLGAIAGHYYDNLSEEAKKRSAFPYKNKAYTIQYQTWWNTELLQKEQEQDNEVYNRTNRAMDWMQVCRDYEIENSGGAFISFKDASIPTKTYFAENYEELIRIKKEYSKDPLNHFRTRKTII